MFAIDCGELDGLANISASWVAVFAACERPKSVRNHLVLGILWWRITVVTLPFMLIKWLLK